MSTDLTNDEQKRLRSLLTLLDSPTMLGEQDKIVVQMFSWGEVKHPNGDFEVDRDFYAQIRESHDYLSGRGYYAPILRQHTDDGYTYGRVLRVFSTDDVPSDVVSEFATDGIYAEAELAAGVVQLHANGFIQNWSPSFYSDWKDPHTGKKLPKVLRELSFVSVPHQKNINSPSPHYALAENGFITLTEAKEPEVATEENTDKDALAALTEQVQGLANVVQTLVKNSEQEPEPTPKEKEPVVATENTEEIERLKSENDALKKQLAEQRAEQTKRELSELNVEDEDEVKRLVELRESDAGAYASQIVALAMKATKESATDNSDKGGSRTPEKGVAGTAPGKADRAEKMKKAQTALAERKIDPTSPEGLQVMEEEFGVTFE